MRDFKYGLGKRTFKTALAVSICVLLTQLIDKNGTQNTFFFMGAGAVVSIQSDIQNSIKTGMQRVLGSATGALVALFTSLIYVHIFQGKLLFLVIFIGIYLLIYLNVQLKITTGLVVSSVVFLAIFTTEVDNGFNYALLRVFDTFAGVLIGVIVNKIIFPVKYMKERGEEDE